MNPRIIGLLIKGNAEKEKYEIQKNNVLYHLLGQYVAEAIQATIGNAHRKKELSRMNILKSHLRLRILIITILKRNYRNRENYLL